MKDKVKRGREGARGGGTWDSDNRERLVLFMRRSVVDRNCVFFKDKIVTADTQRERDKGAFGT